MRERPIQEWQSGDELVAAFARWAADQRTAAAAGERVRERSLREQATAAATWVGVLVDLAEREEVVTAVVADDRRSGRLVGVGRDFCVLEPDHGRTALISLQAVTALWPDGAGAPEAPGGDRGAAIDLSLMTALTLLAEERSPVGLISSNGFETAGELVAAGDDVVMVRTARPGSPARRLVYVPLGAIALCELR